MPGWGLARKVHGRYGLESKQETLLDYRKIFGRTKQKVDTYLGTPTKNNKEDESYDFVYKTDHGIVGITYVDSRAKELSFVFNIPFDGYIAVLRSAGITELTRPMAVNDKRLLYNSNFGNSLLPENPSTNVIISIPESGKIGWRVKFFPM